MGVEAAWSQGMNSNKAERLLLIGAGEVGSSTAKHMMNSLAECELIHLRTLSETSLKTRLHELQHNRDTSISVTGSAGNIFFFDGSIGEDSAAQSRGMADYLMMSPTPETLRQSSIYRIIEEVRPTIIVDSVNAAYATRSAESPFHEIARDLRKIVDSNCEDAAAKLSTGVDDLILGNGPVVIARYIAALGLALQEMDVQRYVRVSTTGLGGMGFNCPYTHGEANAAGVGEALAQKLTTSGALHQLLWNLHHTSGADIALIVPSALIGWEDVQFGPIRSKGGLVPLLDCLAEPPIRPNATCYASAVSPEFLQTVYAPAGDSSHYAIEEMALSTSVGQFEALTKEEVARAVSAAAFGDRSNDLLTFMDKAALGPTYAGAIRRSSLLREMRDMATEKNVVSVASGNFGPAVSQSLFELHFLLASLGNQGFEKAFATEDTDMLAARVERYVLNEAAGRSHALSLGHSIILKTCTLSPAFPCEARDEDSNGVSIDLRAENISVWQRRISAALPTIDSLSRLSSDQMEVGAGEILAGVFLDEGKRRHSSFPLEMFNA
ncbi:hypothetical protein AADZ90_021595 [Aestuariibius sp. 2305UL40-4]|uniref:hypothetical protein n=1 Tax=Aestuariibius violaceus TaxID=3234132 RepID=UPI00345F02E3